jgi:hypothetical protein
MSYGIYEPCMCGHRYAEHSMFGTCRACTECEDDTGSDDEDDHPYDQCECREFRTIAERIA